ncbi:MAG: adenylate/guanylate cyclase domain-containing protein [Nevskia sp.]|nr:adenylate/guanylate cyclase domain-containing protein [Nevskia sp.]
MNQPETKFTRVGNDRVAYQVFGHGPRDMVFSSGLWSHLDLQLEEPSYARINRRIASFCRLIRFDRRDSGVSDPRPDDGGSIDQHWAQDLLAVLEATGSQAPVLAGTVDAGPLILKFLEKHPQRCSGLILGATTASLLQAGDYPQGHSPKAAQRLLELVAEKWGSEEFAALWVPSQAQNPAVMRWFAKLQRAMASPRKVVENLRESQGIDARQVLPGVRVPALVLGRRDARLFTAAQSRYIAEHIPGARYAELPGGDGDFAWDGADEYLGLLEEFVTGQRRGSQPERMLATVLFTDMVDSTRLAAKIGDAAWRQLLDRHDQAVRGQVERYGGRLVDSAGDGALSIFASPGNAIDCAHALHAELKALKLKIKIRAGLHIGELELREDGRVGGTAVHIGARVLGLARGGDVLVSRTVRDVLIGSRYRFKERGIHELKGVPSKWPLYLVEAPKQD